MKPRAYYNEIDPFCCQWLQNLMDAGLIMAGEIDSRSIEDVHPDDVRGIRRVHFFAGIAGWDYALQLAGWPDGQPVWTGSCPCQPFSAAGKRRGVEDERHLWPVLRDLVAECRPAIVLGEQVASRDGREWLAGVRADLETLGYAVGAADLCAAGVAAPHLRQRIYFGAGRLGNTYGDGPAQGQLATEAPRHRSAAVADGRAGALADADGFACDQGRADGGRRVGGGCTQPRAGLGGGGNPGRLGHSDGTGPQGRGLDRDRAGERSPWASSVVLPLSDGTARRIEPEIFPLAHGVPNRVGILRGAGNAIVPQVAATFIEAFMECRP